MSGIPPANIAASIAQATVTEKQNADERRVEDRRKALQAKEQAREADRKEHEVEDTLEAEQQRVRRHDEEESHRQQRHKHRAMPEDGANDDQPEDTDQTSHIDLQA